MDNHSFVDECLEDWADRVQSLGNDAFITVGADYMNEEIVRKFCQGLADKEAATLISSKRLATLAEARQEAKLFRCTQKAVYGSSRKVRAVSFSDEVKDTERKRSAEYELQKDMSELKQLVQQYLQNETAKNGKENKDSTAGSPNWKAGNSSSPGSQRKSICYQCRKEGHIARECPDKKSLSPNERHSLNA